MTKEKKIELIKTYKEKKITSGKCRFKYFLNGFFSPFTPSMQKYCPNCCEKISNEEYFEFGTFVFGCKSCREKL